MNAALINRLWRMSMRPSAKRFAYGLEHVREVQTSILLNTLCENAHTVYGENYDFKGIRSVKDFQKQVPIVQYDELRSYIQRIKNADTNILHTGLPICLEPTSGTTSGRKLIPYSAALKKQFQEAINAWLYFQFGEYPETMNGAAYWSISPPLQARSVSAGGIPIGFEDDSQYLSKWSGMLAKQILAVPSVVSKLTSLEDFRYATLFYLLSAENLSFVSIWNPTFISIILNDLSKFGESLYEDISSGKLHLPSNPDQAWITKRPNTARAIVLRDFLSSSANTDYSMLWPNLSAISCWTHAASAPHAKDLMQSFSKAKLLAKGLLSTEGVVSIPHPHSEFPVIATHTHFYEFIRVDTGAVYCAWELEQGLHYEVVLTTAGGLYRYRTGDCVCVRGFYQQTPTLEFLGRTGITSDLCGEKLTEAFVIDCLGRAGLRGCVLVGCGNKYILHIPCDQYSDMTNEKTRQLDGYLCENFHYAHCRKIGQLGALEIQVSQMNTVMLQQHLQDKNITARPGDIKPIALLQSLP